MSYHTIAVANTIVKKSIDLKIPDFTHLKLQNLLYLSHAWILGLTHKPLIDDVFNVWKIGPISYVVHCYFCTFKREINQLSEICIKDKDVSIYKKPLLKGKKYKLINNIIDMVLDYYGYRTVSQLFEITRAPNGPWDMSLRKGEEIISNELIEKHMGVKIKYIENKLNYILKNKLTYS